MQGGKIWLKFEMERASATQILPTNQNQWKIQTKQQPLINFTRIFGFDMEFSFAAGDHGSSKRQFYLTAIHLPILSLRSTELFAIFALFTHTQTNTHTFAIATHNQLNEENNIEIPIPKNCNKSIEFITNIIQKIH